MTLYFLINRYQFSKNLYFLIFDNRSDVHFPGREALLALQTHIYYFPGDPYVSNIFTCEVSPAKQIFC